MVSFTMESIEQFKQQNNPPPPQLFLGPENIMSITVSPHHHMTPSRCPLLSLLPSNIEQLDKKGGVGGSTQAQVFLIIKMHHESF